MARTQANIDKQQQGQQSGQSWADRLKQWVRNNHERQPALGAELAAIGREAVKDIRATLMESYFGKPEHASEPGTPLSPTMQEVSAGRGLNHRARFSCTGSRWAVF